MEFLARIHGRNWKAPNLKGKACKRAATRGIGEYCKGESVSECKAIFGEKLEDVCASCPD